MRNVDVGVVGIGDKFVFVLDDHREGVQVARSVGNPLDDYEGAWSEETGDDAVIGDCHAFALLALDLEGDEAVGVEIIRRAIEAPLRQIATNAGHDGSVIVEDAKEKEGNVGFDASTGEWVDMVKAGIIDPAKVVRSALQNAASIAGLMLTTDTLVTDLPDVESAAEGVVY